MDSKPRQLAEVLASPTTTDEGLERLCRTWDVEPVYRQSRDGQVYLDWNMVIPRLAQRVLESEE